jgi:hypothetical protein
MTVRMTSNASKGSTCRPEFRVARRIGGWIHTVRTATLRNCRVSSDGRPNRRCGPGYRVGTSRSRWMPRLGAGAGSSSSSSPACASAGVMSASASTRNGWPADTNPTARARSAPRSSRRVSGAGSGARWPGSGARRFPAAACWPASHRPPGPVRSPRCKSQTHGDPAARPHPAGSGSGDRTRW